MVKLYNLYPNTRGKTGIHLVSHFPSRWRRVEFGCIIKSLEDEKYLNGQAIRVVFKYPRKREAYTKQVLFHPFDVKKIYLFKCVK